MAIVYEENEAQALGNRRGNTRQEGFESSEDFEPLSGQSKPAGHDASLISGDEAGIDREEPGNACVKLARRFRHHGFRERSEEAILLALQHSPQHVEARLLKAGWLYEEGRDEQAEDLVRPLLAEDLKRLCPRLDENLILAATDLAQHLRKRGRTTLADSLLASFLALDPPDSPMRQQFGMLLLKRGDFKTGWRERDRRVGPFPRPAWDGSSLEGKTILVQALHGFGDVIQFLRFLPPLKEQGARVLLEHPPALVALLMGVEGWDTLIARNTGREAFAYDFDCHIPLMTLPALLNTEGNIPTPIPYIRTDAVRVAWWRERLAGQEGLKVGLVWAGSPDFKGDAERSCRLMDYAPLARLSGVHFFSLQLGGAAEQSAYPPAGLRLTDLSPELRDFTDTAAAIENLDLIITVDTAVAHLAGALGRPVWTLLPFHGCWRWMSDREDSPWYPTMRLFQQRTPGDWNFVLFRVQRELQMLLRPMDGRQDSPRHKRSAPSSDPG